MRYTPPSFLNSRSGTRTPGSTLHECLAQAMEAVHIMFPDYENIHQAIHVRVTNLPIEDPIRDLRQVHWGVPCDLALAPHHS